MELFETLLLILMTVAVGSMALPAFPGAEGYGAEATGGRGGQVIHVTNLRSEGPGSFSAACTVKGPRIVVFDTCGVINGDAVITSGNITIAGETAPGGGITLNGKLWTEYERGINNLIVRFLRVRPDDLSGNQGDAIQFSLSNRWILDHVSACWGSDETIDAYEADSITVQWCTIEASATSAGHPDGSYHNYGMINGPDGGSASVHHNLWAHHNHRTPAIANGPSDIRNNVVYNSTTGFVHHNPTNDGGFNFVGNYYRTGPTKGEINPWWFDDEDDPPGSYFLHDNYIDDPGEFTGVLEDPWTGTYSGTSWYGGTKADSPFDVPPVITHSCEAAYDTVLASAGCFPRDTVTRKTVSEVRKRTGDWGREVPEDLFAGLSRVHAPIDSDRDGMPDEWEQLRGLDPSAADGGDDDDGDGYVNVEEYLHYCAQLKLESDVPVGRRAVTRPKISRSVDGVAAYYTPSGRYCRYPYLSSGVMLKVYPGGRNGRVVSIGGKLYCK